MRAHHQLRQYPDAAFAVELATPSVHQTHNTDVTFPRMSERQSGDSSISIHVPIAQNSLSRSVRLPLLSGGWLVTSTRLQHLAMQALSNKSNARVQPFTSAQTRPARVRVVQCQAQQNSQLQQVAAAVVAASCLVAPAAHAATEVIQSGVDVATAVGSAGAVAGLGALLVATDPQKRCSHCHQSLHCSLLALPCDRSGIAWPGSTLVHLCIAL
jgi:hypothetical protein